MDNGINHKALWYALLMVVLVGAFVFHRSIILGGWVLASPQERVLGEVVVSYSRDLFEYPGSGEQHIVIGIIDANPVVAYKREVALTLYAEGGIKKFRLVRDFCDRFKRCRFWVEQMNGVEVLYSSFEGRLDGVAGNFHLYGFIEEFYMEFHGRKEPANKLVSSLQFRSVNNGGSFRVPASSEDSIPNFSNF